MLVALVMAGSLMGQPPSELRNLFAFPNAAGVLETFNTFGDGTIDFNGPFFQPFSENGNGRSCFTCHRPDQGWGISVEGVQLQFFLTQGTDPLFRPVDATNCGNALPTDTLDEREQAYSLLLNRAVVRTTIAVPAPMNTGGTAEFQIVNINNPYAITGDTSCGKGAGNIPLYRRPIPTTNLKFISAVQWDGRDSRPPAHQKIIYGSTWPGTLMADLNGTTVSATTKRLEDTISPNDPRVQQITDLELNNFTAQAFDWKGGALDSHGASGGPVALATVYGNPALVGTATSPAFYIGINDPFPGGNPSGAPFTSTIFTLFNPWANNTGGFRANARATIARGQAVFNNTVINITGVAGINDVVGMPVFKGACATCHDAPGVGDHSVAAPLNIGIANPPASNVLDSSYLPVYTLKNVNMTSSSFGQTVQTTDPGVALLSGKWADIGKFKGPILRGLASRAPYFHNGLAQSLDDVVNFYNMRFNIGLTPQQHSDLVAFLSTL